MVGSLEVRQNIGDETCSASRVIENFRIEKFWGFEVLGSIIADHDFEADKGVSIVKTETWYLLQKKVRN